MRRLSATQLRLCPMYRPILLALAATVVLWLLPPGQASAHAHLVQANPAPDAVIARAPAVATFVFDEALNPTLTHVRVADASGRDMAGARGHLAAGHGAELWLLALPRLQPGTYSVFWTSESATDGHVMSSFYTFRVAPPGGGWRPVGGSSGGSAAPPMGAASGASSLFEISPDAGAMALASWVGQMAQALWLGILVVELTVLAPARRTYKTSESRLARLATRRTWRLHDVALAGIVASLVGQTVCVALQGTDGNWLRALAPATLGGILSSQNGQLTLARLVVALVALLVVHRVPVPAYVTQEYPGSMAAGRPARVARPAAHAIGIVAPLVVAPRWESARFTLIVMAALYTGLAALSSHAAAVSPMWLACSVDWLHLACTGAWIGGMAVLAYGVLPARAGLPSDERAPALLPLLDRFSPAAYVAVASLTLTGLYTALTHLHSPAMVTGTTYGHLLGLKSGLVGLLMALSASHVLRLRPVIAWAQQNIGMHVGALATVHEGLATLAGRIRLEAGIGAGILLLTALMGQTLPATAPRMATTGATAPATSASMAVPRAITATAVTGDLRGQLTIAPPAIGAVTMTLRLWERGRLLTADTGAAIVRLYPAAQPPMRATLTPAAAGARFAARGSLAMGGTWRAVVLVRTVMVDSYRTLPFTFIAGPGAHFLTVGAGYPADGSHHDAMAGM